MRVEFVQTNTPDLPVRICAGTTKLKKTGHVGTHIHDDVEILVGLGGLFEVKVENSVSHLEKGDVIIINRRIPHETRSLVPYTGNRMLQFKAEKLRAGEFEHMNKYLSVLFAAKEKPFVLISHNDPLSKKIGDLIAKIAQENIKKEANYDLFIRGYMNVLLGELYRSGILTDVAVNYNTDAMQKIWPVIKFIDENFSRSLELDDLCAILNINRHYFCRIFKKATGTTPIEYINFVRIWKAENLLTTTDKSVLEIAMEVGFSSVTYFNRVFRRLKNTTPTVYRNILYARNKAI